MKKILTIATIASLAACGPAPKNESENNQTPASSGKMTTSSPWQTTEVQISDAGRLITKTISPENEAWLRQEQRETTIESLPLNSSHNTAAYTIKSRINNGKFAYAAPKIYSYKRDDRARAALRKNADGSVTIPFHVALTDGMSRTIPGPDGITKISLPEAMYVDRAQLAATVKRLGYEDIATLDGCPRKFIVSVSGVDYEATPAGFKSAEYCELNRPITVTITVPQKEADYIINQALHDSTVDIRALFEVKAGYLTGETIVAFNKRKIYEELKASLEASYPPYAQTTVQAHIKKIFEMEMMNVVVKGDRTNALNDLIKQAMTSFIRPFAPTPDLPIPPQCYSAVCINLALAESEESRDFSFRWMESTTTLTGQTILALGKLQPLQTPQIIIGDRPQDMQNNAADLISNENNASSKRELVTVKSGDVMELSIPTLIAEEGEMATYTSEWIAKKDVCAERKSGFGGNICVKYKTLNQYKYYFPIKTVRKDNPMGRIKSSVYQGLHLQFTDIRGAALTCSLADLGAISQGDRFVIHFQDTARCPIFNGQPRATTMVTVVNKLKHEVVYKDNVYFDNWHGSKPTDRDFALKSREGLLKIGLKVNLRSYDLN